MCYDKLNLPKDTPEADKYCKIKFEVKEDVPGPVYFSYQITGFYQNHKTMVQSRNHWQLKGNYIEGKKLRDCNPIELVGDLRPE